MKAVSVVHKKVGKKIRKIREEQDLSQEELAFRVGVDRSYMGFIERGERNPTLSKLSKIAKVFKIPLSDLF